MDWEKIHNRNDEKDRYLVKEYILGSPKDGYEYDQYNFSLSLDITLNTILLKIFGPLFTGSLPLFMLGSIYHLPSTYRVYMA